MAISLKHTFQSAKSDGADTTLVQPSNWNAEHTITAAAGKVLGRDTSGAGAVQELPIAVDTSGNVGIGTSSPGYKLDVGSFSTSATQTIRVAAASGNDSQIKLMEATDTYGFTIRNANASGLNILRHSADATGTTAMFIGRDTGNVGIGTSSPTTKFAVSDVSKYTFSVSNAYTLLTSVNAAGSAFADAYVNGLSHIWQTSGTERMRIDSAGNVGIGTSSPQQRLHVSQLGGNAFAGIRAQNSNSGTGIAGIEFSSDATYAKAAIGLVRADANGVGSIVFFNSSSTGSANWSSTDERMRIDNLGQVGIGTNAPGSTLHISGDGDTAVRITKVGQADYSWQTLTGGTLRLYSFTAAAEVFSFASNGAIFSAPTYNNTATGSTVVVTSTGAIRRTSSSIKYKKDVETLDPALATNAIEGLRPVWYRTKNAEGDDKATWSHIGLIAEEVDLIEPRLVRYRTAEIVTDQEGNRTEVELETPEPEDVDYARLSVLLLAEVQSLRDRIAALEARP